MKGELRLFLFFVLWRKVKRIDAESFINEVPWQFDLNCHAIAMRIAIG